MTKRRKLPRIFHGNCLLVMLVLWLRGRIPSLFFRGGHCMGNTRRSHWIHFKALDPALPFYKKLWFPGQMEVIHLTRRGRRVCTSLQGSIQGSMVA